ncbi:MAG: hypothetical protein EBZ20_10145, partial [Rhodobacteraceae bacterium]|nr:hypothetical protein [Paracoccaceae bacterium]
ETSEWKESSHNAAYAISKYHAEMEVWRGLVEGLDAFIQETRETRPQNVELIELDCHINDPEFSETALAILDHWIAEGVIKL